MNLDAFTRHYVDKVAAGETFSLDTLILAKILTDEHVYVLLRPATNKPRTLVIDGSLDLTTKEADRILELWDQLDQK